MTEIMKFEDTEVEIIEINGVPHFEVYSTGMALGQVKSVVRNVQTYRYPFKERIDQNIKNAGITPTVRDGRPYINEAQLYDLMLEMKTDKCRPFRKWVTAEVLPSLRRNGTYTLPGAQPRTSPIEATSAGGVAQLIRQIRATMKDNGQPPEVISQVVKGICDQFGINLPPNFVKVNPFQQLALVGVFWQGQGQLPGQ